MKPTDSLAYVKLEYFLIRVGFLKEMLYLFWNHNIKELNSHNLYLYIWQMQDLWTEIILYVRESGKQSQQGISYSFLESGSWQPTPHSQVLLNTHIHWPEPNEWSNLSSPALLYWHQLNLSHLSSCVDLPPQMFSISFVCWFDHRRWSLSPLVIIGTGGSLWLLQFLGLRRT